MTLAITKPNVNSLITTSGDMDQWSSTNAYKNNGIFDELYLLFFSFFVFTKSRLLWFVVNKAVRNLYQVWRIKTRIPVLIRQNINCFASSSNITLWESDHSHFCNLIFYSIKSSNSGSHNPPIFTSSFAPLIIVFLQRGGV